MEIFIEKDYNAVSKRAGKIISSFIKENPKAVLGLATGLSPLKTYSLLAKKYKDGKISFKDIITFNLDEYLALDNNSKQSYHSFMKKNFFDKININIKNTFFPTDFYPYEKYDKVIKNKGGIDLQILGIGRNGHIGFNEPGSNFSSKTRQVFLKKTTIKDNARFFKSIKDVPKKAVTTGIKNIMESKNIILLASGKDKQKAIYNTVFGKINTKNPSSILQKHKSVILIIDEPCAKLIKNRIKCQKI